MDNYGNIFTRGRRKRWRAIDAGSMKRNAKRRVIISIAVMYNATVERLREMKEVETGR